MPRRKDSPRASTRNRPHRGLPTGGGWRINREAPRPERISGCCRWKETARRARSRNPLRTKCCRSSPRTDTTSPMLPTSLDVTKSMFGPFRARGESGRCRRSGEAWLSTSFFSWPALWSPNGRELFYRNGPEVVVVDVDTRGEPILGTPKVLFEAPSTLRGPFSISAGGGGACSSSIEARLRPRRHNWCSFRIGPKS